ncbi:MAG: HAMP domain-containing histidine kinase [Planctomycetes bacterium]|nr:HAMP domain-containing histidine kinase [Planctomycetota bacterium]
MPVPRSRFSRTHLLALGAFLLPLLALAVLGARELQRSGDQAQAALAGEAREFLARARQGIEQQLDATLAEAFRGSERRLAEHGPVRTTLQLREQASLPSLQTMILLDEQLDLAEPSLPVHGISLPLVREAERDPENAVRASLQAADLLLAHGRRAEGAALLRHLLETVEDANPPGRDRRPDIEEVELLARFRLGNAQRAIGQHDDARQQYDRVRRLVAGFGRSYRVDGELASYGLLAESALAELGTADERLSLLRAIADNQHDQHADGLLSAVAGRLAATFPADAPERATVDALLVEERQRAATRRFGEQYELWLKFGLKMRRLRQPEGDLVGERLCATIGDETMLVAVRRATAEEQQRWRRCAYVAMQFHLPRLLAPALHAFTDTTGTFALAVDDPLDVAILPPPPATLPGYEAPAVETNSLQLRAFPADAARLDADARAADRQRTLLLLAVFATAIGGAFWAWRSVSREQELARLKLELVSRVSHELKTPLALIRMYGETLGMGRARDGEQAAEFGSIIARESERLTGLIQNILDFSRQQAGTLRYTPQPVDLGQLLREITTAYGPHLEARGALLIDSLPPDILVVCDPSACESAVVNLLENAAKYGQDGVDEHEIEIDLVRSGERAVITVADRGRGIPEAERHRVFDGFYRASNAGEVRGAGLGLGLVRHFARAHGGDVEALPRDGGGTILRLWLPLVATAKAPVPDPSAAAARVGRTDAP